MMEKDMGAIPGSREPDPASGSGPTGFDPARIADSLSAEERQAMLHREGGSESCMSWEVSHSLYDRGLTLRHARFLRVTWLGAKVRTALQDAIATEARRAETPEIGSVHEGAGPQDIAQDTIPSSDMGKGE